MPHSLGFLAATLLFLAGCDAISVSHNGGAVQFEPLEPPGATSPFEQHASHRRAAQASFPAEVHERQPYGEQRDRGHLVLAVPDLYLSARTIRQDVAYSAPYPSGTIVVDPAARYLYHLKGHGRAMRYFVGVGAAGREFTGSAQMARKRDWPRWTPTPEMITRDPGTYGPWRGGMKGGGNNPLGARALYLYQNGRDTLYRIHGTPHPSSVGRASSNGCIRMFNQDVIHLAAQAQVGAQVVVLSQEQSGDWTGPTH